MTAAVPEPLPHRDSSPCGPSAVWHPCSASRPDAIARGSAPCGRSFHTLTPVNLRASDGDVRRFLLLAGGRRADEITPDAWLFCIASQRWARLSLTSGPEPADVNDGVDSDGEAPFARAYHTAVAVNVPAQHRCGKSLSDVAVILHGGKVALENDVSSVSAGVFMVRFAVSQCTSPDQTNADTRTDGSQVMFGVAASVRRINDRATTVGRRAYHGSTVLTSPMGMQHVVVYGGFSGMRFLDVVSVFDLVTESWTHHFPTATLPPGDVEREPSQESTATSAVTSSVSPCRDDGDDVALADAAQRPIRAPKKRRRRRRLARSSGGRCARVDDGTQTPDNEPAERGASFTPGSPQPAVSHRSAAAAADPCKDLCPACGAAAGCIHESKLAHLLGDGRLLSGATSSMRGNRPSMPPRDAAVVLADPTQRGRLCVLGGEVAGTFFNSALSIELGPFVMARRSAAATDASSRYPPQPTGVGSSSAASSASSMEFESPAAACWFPSVLGVEENDHSSSASSAAQRNLGSAATADHQAVDDNDDVPLPRGYQCGWNVGGRCVAVWGGFRPFPAPSSSSSDSSSPSEEEESSPSVPFTDHLFLFDAHRQSWRRVAAQRRIVPDDMAACARSGASSSSSHALDGPPPARASAAAASVELPGNDERAEDAPRCISSAFVFGGDNGKEYFGDLWRCDIVDAVVPTESARFTLRSACEAFLRRHRRPCLVPSPSSVASSMTATAVAS